MKSADFQLFIKANGLTQKSVAEYLEVSPTFMNQIAKGERPIPTDKFQKLLDHPTWDTAPLLNVAREETPTYENTLNLSPLPFVGEVHTADNSGDIATQITDVESVVAEEVPYLERPVIESREINIRDYVESEDVKTIVPQGLIPTGISFARKIYSDAMAPDIREGDIILCNFVPDTAHLVDGDIYVVETSKYGCVVRDIQHDGEDIILMARNPKSPDLRVRQSEIKSVAVPIQLIRSTFSQRTDYSKMLREKDERIGLLVEREFDHIRHTDKLLEQLDKVTTQQGKVIEALVEKVK